MVRPELHFKSISRFLLRRLHDAGVVNKGVNLAVFSTDLLSSLAH